MGNAVSNLCDCTHKDPRTEINMFLTQNQTIQFSSPIENIKMPRKEPLTQRSSSSSSKINGKYKIKDNFRNDISHNIPKSRNDRNKFLCGNKTARYKSDFMNEKKEFTLNKNKNRNNLQLNDLNIHSFNYSNINSKVNNLTTKSNNSNISFCHNKINPTQIINFNRNES